MEIHESLMLMRDREIRANAFRPKRMENSDEC